MRRFIVYRYSEESGYLTEYDIVFYNVSCTEKYVRDTLINRDGYPSDIVVRQE
jgi:hypothetical protein